MDQLLLFGYFDFRCKRVLASPAPLRPAIQRCIVSIHTCAVIVSVEFSLGSPKQKGVRCEAGSHLDSQAPYVVYHQISTPFPADEELVRIDV
jgi:hypothetical protein